MFLSKIKKHLSLLTIRIKEKKTIQNISNENGLYLNNILEAFLKTKKNQFSKNEILIFETCELYRKSLLKNEKMISYKELGLEKNLSVKNICREAAASKIWCQFLFSLIQSVKKTQVLELGTNLGVSGTYILNAIKDKEDDCFTTMEGVSELCKMADKQFKKINQEKYHLIKGLYTETFPILLKQKKKFNIVFIDGDHKKKPTLHYFYNLKQKLIYPTIIIFDDINWNDEMIETWDVIKKDPNVIYSVDLFKLGVVILKKNIVKQKKHYNLHLTYS